MWSIRSPSISRAWNEDRFADAKLIRGTPFAPALARRLGNYVRRDGVDPRALLDYLSGFSKINNRDRFQRDVWEGEAQFDRVFRSSATAVAQRIAYLYPDAKTPELCARYLKQFSGLIATAREQGIRVIAVKLPIRRCSATGSPTRRHSTTRYGSFSPSRRCRCGFFRRSGQPEFLLRHRPFEPRRGYRVIPTAVEAAAHDTRRRLSQRRQGYFHQSSRRWMQRICNIRP